MDKAILKIENSFLGEGCLGGEVVLGENSYFEIRLLICLKIFIGLNNLICLKTFICLKNLICLKNHFYTGRLEAFYLIARGITPGKYIFLFCALKGHKNQIHKYSSLYSIL